MITRPKFVSIFRDKAVELWSKRIDFEVREYPDDQLSAAVRLVETELRGIVVR